MSEPTLQDCINYMRSQIKQMEKYPKNYEFNLPYYKKTVELLEDERPHGKWIDLSDGWQEGTFRCSSCQMEFVLLEGTPEDNEYNFCPNCRSDNRPKGGEAE